MDYTFYNNNSTHAAFQPQHFGHYAVTEAQYTPVTTAPQQVYQNGHDFQQFDSAYQFQSNDSYIASKQPEQLPTPPQHVSAEPSPGRVTGHSLNGDYNSENQEQEEARSSDEEKESMTPAQNRRKAQNRAAQRAFRERKERHVKDLENKLHSLSAHSSTLLSDNERLKRELQRLATQNEILRATSSAASGSARSPSPVSGPQTFSPIDFQDAVTDGQYPLSFEDYGGADGQRLLAVGATWDYIMNHSAYKSGQIDMELVQYKLRGRTQCNGRGPAFREQDVIRAIEESATSAGDRLL